MRSWNSGSRDLKLKNGKVVKEYFLMYVSTNKKEILFLEKIGQALIDKKLEDVLGEEK